MILLDLEDKVAEVVQLLLQITKTGFEQLCFNSGAKRIRTADPLNAIEVRYQLRYNPKTTSR